MRGGRFLSCRHGATGVVHLVVVMVLVMVFIFPEYKQEGPFIMLRQDLGFLGSKGQT